MIRSQFGTTDDEPSGEVFWKSIRKLGCECLLKKAPAFVQRINSGFSGASNWFFFIRVNPSYPWLSC
jgi:hypothetical protein